MSTATKTKTKVKEFEKKLAIIEDALQRRIDELNKGLEHQIKCNTDALTLVCKAQEIITRFEDKDNELYVCDCNSKNKYAINAFFESVVEFKRLYGYMHL